MGFLVVLNACSNFSDTKGPESHSPETPIVSENPEVSVNALISSGGLSISSPTPDIVSNSVFLGTSVSQVDFKEKTIKIKNDTAGDIPVVITLAQSAFRLTLNRCPVSLAAGKSCEILVRFLPRSLYSGEYSETLAINSNPDLTFVISATVTNNPVPTEGPIDLKVEYTPFEQDEFDASITRREITLTNNSPDKIAPAGSLTPMLSGSNSNVYNVWLNRCTAPLMPMKSCKITITTTRFIKEQTSYPSVSISLGAQGNLKVACKVGEDYDAANNLCLDVTAPPLPSIIFVTQYPSDQSLLKFKVDVCEENSKIYYSLSSTTPTNASSWVDCDTSLEYEQDISVGYSGNHTRVVHYWVKDDSNNQVSDSFSVAYYPEALVIGNQIANNRLYSQHSRSFTKSGGVPETFFTFSNDQSSDQGASITEAGVFSAGSLLNGSVSIKLRDSNLPSNKSVSYSFDVFSCLASQTFNNSLYDCRDNEISCVNEISNSVLAKKTWNNASAQYGSCVLESCSIGYIATNNICVQSTYSISLTQPAAGATLSSPATVNYGQSATITFAPQANYVLTSWAGDCLGQPNTNTCVLSNVTSNKSVSVIVGCAPNYQMNNNVCSLIQHNASITQPALTGAHSSGLIAGPTVINQTQSATYTYTPPTNHPSYYNVTWSGDCAGQTGSTCTLSNVMSAKAISANVDKLPFSISTSIPSMLPSGTVQLDHRTQVNLVVTNAQGATLGSANWMRPVSTTIDLTLPTDIGVYTSLVASSTPVSSIVIPASAAVPTIYVGSNSAYNVVSPTSVGGVKTLIFSSTSGATNSLTPQFLRPTTCLDALNKSVRKVPSSSSESYAQSTTSGKYVIDIDGSGSLAPFLAECDQSYAGGGWTVVVPGVTGGTTAEILAYMSNFGSVANISPTAFSDSVKGIGWGSSNNVKYKTFSITSLSTWSQTYFSFSNDQDLANGTGLGKMILTSVSHQGRHWDEGNPSGNITSVGVADGLGSDRTMYLSGVNVSGSDTSTTAGWTNKFVSDSISATNSKHISMTGYSSPPANTSFSPLIKIYVYK